MRTKTNILAWCLPILAFFGICLSTNSCRPEGLVDESEFSLYYSGITDVGPSMNISVTPTWHGAEPSNFQIYQVTLDGNNLTGVEDAFTVDETNGTVSLSNTDELTPGLYVLGISCVSGGKTFQFPDAVIVNMLPGVPEEIKVTPSKISVSLEEILNPETKLQTAQITTDGNHVKILNISLNGVRHSKNGWHVANADKLFTVTPKGEISVNAGPGFEAGTYHVDVKITTHAAPGDSKKGIMPDALILEVTSAPLELTYTPTEDNFEAGTASKSPVPVLVGSKDDLVYTFTSTPTCEGLEIDPATGVLSLPQGHSLQNGFETSINVTATNKFGSKTFENVYKFTVVEEITGITELSYNDISGHITKTSFVNEPTEQNGSLVTYSLKNLVEELQEVTIDKLTGKVSAPKKNSIPVGDYELTVVAQNSKSSMETTFKIGVVENPNEFTFVHWGNNIGLEPAKDYASQYRIAKDVDPEAPLKIQVAENDLPTGVAISYSMDPVYVKSDLVPAPYTINETDGTITAFYDKTRIVNACIITVTAGEGEAAISKKVPVFFQNMLATKMTDNEGEHEYYVEYKPFAICINPVKGGSGPAPKIYAKDCKTEVSAENLNLDYRRSFMYFNINGPESHGDGGPKKEGAFLTQMWDKYYFGGKSNYGARAPMSWFDNKAQLSKALGYIDNSDGHLVINPNKFVDASGVPANGLFVGQTTVLMNGKGTDTGKDGAQIFPLMVWFDTQFE